MHLQVAAFCPSTNAFVPEKTAVLWLQGCTRNCHGCCAPMWQDPAGGFRESVQEVSRWVQESAAQVLVVSGGEPAEQTAAVCALMQHLESLQLASILYTGYTLAQLQVEKRKLIACFDVLICGPYIETLDDSKGLRGSSNQEIFFRTPRLAQYRELFVSAARRLEMEVRPDGILSVGIPPARVARLWS